jgi:hypothetical protein
MLGLRSVPTSHTQAQYRTRPSLLHGIQTEVVANASLLPLMELEPNWNWNAFRGRIGVSIGQAAMVIVGTRQQVPSLHQDHKSEQSTWTQQRENNGSSTLTYTRHVRR